MSISLEGKGKLLRIGKMIAGKKDRYPRLTRSDSVTHAFRNSVVRDTQKRVRGSFSLVSPSIFAGRIRVIREIGARPAGDCVTRVTANRSTARSMNAVPDVHARSLLSLSSPPGTRSGRERFLRYILEFFFIYFYFYFIFGWFVRRSSWIFTFVVSRATIDIERKF